MKVFSAGQIKEWDNFTILHEPVTPINLMERAATALFHQLEKEVGSAKIDIYCGLGNNGGDGLVLARLFHTSGKNVRVFIVTGVGKETNDFKTNLDRCKDLGINLISLNSIDDLSFDTSGIYCLDAIFGTGLNRKPEGLSLEVIRFLNSSAYKIVAVDVPSGMRIDVANQDENGVVNCQATFTFQTVKYAFLFAFNYQFTGDVRVVNIGLLDKFRDSENCQVIYVEREVASRLLPPRKLNSEKRDFGSALIIGGSKGMMGAMIFAAKACVQSGSGLTTVFVPSSGYEILQLGVPEAMCITGNAVDHHSDFTIDLSTYTSIAIGPGMGTHPETAKFISESMVVSRIPIIIDADGLNHIAREKLLDKIPQGSLITPHKREFERLFGAFQNEDERIKFQRQISQERKLFILFKGKYSKLSTPDGKLFINSTGNAALAKGGSGDVLTGLICGLFARTGSLGNAAILGMYLHGKMADIAVRNTFEDCITASELIELLPIAFAETFTNADD